MIFQKTKAKDIIHKKSEIDNTVLETIRQMATIVGRTLGPGGNPVLIDRNDLAPLITKDGVTVAKSLGVSDAASNIIMDSCKEICINTATEAGDGTTTAIVLADAIARSGQHFLQNNPKYNPQKMINELRHAYDTVIVPLLEDIARPTKTEEELINVATISANGDTEIADSVVEAVYSAGDDGTVLIVENQGRKTEVISTEGFVIQTGLKDFGQIGPVFINDKANQQAKMDNGKIVLYDGSLNDAKVPTQIQTAVADDHGYTDGSPILVVAHDFADSVLDSFAKITKGGQQVIPVKTPRSGLPNGASMFLQDLGAYCGGFVFDPGTINELNEDDMGCFTDANINLYEGIITCNNIDEEAIQDRVEVLKSIESQAFSELDKMWVRKSIANLTCGIATIKVGGTSDLEIREKKDRVEDAVEAVRSAEAEGVVSGGCTTHLLIAEVLKNHPDRKDSWVILTDALYTPFMLLLENCGENLDDVWIELEQEIKQAATSRRLPHKAFNARDYKYVDPMSTGLIEPAKVCRVSLGNALSVATLLTTLGGIVVVPRDSNMENQMEMAKMAFDNMMSTAE